MVNPTVNFLLELKTKLERGASQAENGELLDGDEVFEELRQMIEARQHGKGINRKTKPNLNP